MQSETQSPTSTQALAPGVLSLMNSHAALQNVGRGDQLDYWSQVGGHRYESPSSGSMTPYIHANTVTTKNVAAGMELFLYRGEDWYESRYDHYGRIPRPQDYEQAQELLRKLHQLETRWTLSETITIGSDLYAMIQNLGWNSQVVKVLPPSYTDITDIVEHSFPSWLAAQLNTTKSIEELESTGRCLDSIVTGQSSLPQAGRGALSTRNFVQGEVITGSPLIMVPEPLSYLYDFIYDEELEQTVVEMRGYQLWYNYCMGHSNSSVLICPYGTGVHTINHSNRPNVKLQWSTSNKETWFQITPRELRKINKPAPPLMMDYVALRDIEEGEELFIDYGDEWEQEWRDVVENWQGNQEDSEYMSATAWNWHHAHYYLYTTKEQDVIPYPFNLEMRCHPTVYSEDYEEAERLRQYNRLWPTWEKGDPCDVYERKQMENDEWTYTVFVYLEDFDEAVTRHDVKRDLIAMIDKPYTTDWHRREAFRHYIGIPDSMFPEAWMGEDLEDDDDDDDEEDIVKTDDILAEIRGDWD